MRYYEDGGDVEPEDTHVEPEDVYVDEPNAADLSADGQTDARATLQQDGSYTLPTGEVIRESSDGNGYFIFDEKNKTVTYPDGSVYNLQGASPSIWQQFKDLTGLSGTDLAKTAIALASGYGAYADRKAINEASQQQVAANNALKQQFNTTAQGILQNYLTTGHNYNQGARGGALRAFSSVPQPGGGALAVASQGINAAHPTTEADSAGSGYRGWTGVQPVSSGSQSAPPMVAAEPRQGALQALAASLGDNRTHALQENFGVKR